MYINLKYLILFIVIIVLSITIKAQRGNCEKTKNTEAIYLFEQANKLPKYKYREIEKLLKKAISLQSNFVDAQYELAKHYRFLANKSSIDIKKINKNYLKAEKHFLIAIESCPSYQYYSSYFYLGEFYFKIRKYQKANLFLNEYLLHSNQSDKKYSKTLDMTKNIKLYLELINNKVPFNPQPLINICTKNDEYLPLISPDASLLFFSKRTLQNPNTSYEKYIEQLYYSEKLSTDSAQLIFSDAIVMSEPFNDGRNQGSTTITIDNRHLLITICEFERSTYSSYRNCDIFSSDFKDGKWTHLKRLGENINNNNTFEGQPSITADGNTLYFASNKKGGYGGLDIYKSIRDKKGNWLKAENIGPVINTKGDEKTPFIHSDSQTLYYSTNGRFGLGGFDVFYSQYKGLGHWTEPLNIGYPINTENDELGLIVSTDGKRILFSSKLFEKKNDWDIYIADLYKKARPKKVLFVKGKITDKKGKAITEAEVGLKNLKTSKLTEGMVDKKTGDYAVAVDVKEGEDFLIIAKKNGAFFKSFYINPSLKEYEPPTTINLQIEQIEKNKPVRLNNVNFETGRSTLNKISKANINLLIQFLKENPKIKIKLLGHTDNQGDNINNLNLSIKRTKAVKKYICSKGIDCNRMKYRGYGANKPLKPNTTDKNKAINRRVEFMIIK